MALTRRRHHSVSTTTIGVPTMLASYVLLFAWAFVVLFPLYWLAVTSLKTPLDVNDGPFYIPWRDFQPNLDNWRYIFVDLGPDTFRPYINTVVVGLTNPAITLILAYVASHLPIVVWLMRDYFQSIPIELEESAAIDGASPYRIFRTIVLPLSIPGLVATFLFVLVFAWNEYLIALFLTSANAQTLPLTVAAQNATRGPQWWYMSVLILIMIGPVIAMAIALERFIARGLLVGAVKG